MFKEKAIKFQEEKEDMIEVINRGIRKFNNINNKRVEYIEDLSEYDTPVSYICGEKGIGITWFDDVGRCGSTYYEKEYQLIPYAYFEEDEDLNKINADIEAREAHKGRIKEAQREEININSKRLTLEQEIRELNQVNSKYGIDTKQKISDKKIELVKCKADLERQKTKVMEVKNEL